MEKGSKERLNIHVENIFSGFTRPGLHICDIATGGGKSYSIGKLTCGLYSKEFDKIIILCVQTKLVDGIVTEINKSIDSEDRVLGRDQILVVANNSDVISDAVRKGNLKALMDRINYVIDVQKNNYDVKRLRYIYNGVNKTSKALEGLFKTLDSTGSNDYIKQQIDEAESKLRKGMREFIELFRRHLEKTAQYKKVNYEIIIKFFPELKIVYPQVEIRRKKVLIMTVHKAMYGVDPLWTEKIQLADFYKLGKKCLILFDESDQAAIAMRNVIIEQAIASSTGNRRFAKGYHGYLQYKGLISNPEHISDEYFGEDLSQKLQRAKSITDRNWTKKFGEIDTFRSIFLGDDEDIEEYRRGVFFSGTGFQLDITTKQNKQRSYICYKKGRKHLSMVHSDSKESLEKEYNVVLSLDRFLSLIINNTTIIKSHLAQIINAALKQSRENFDEEQGKVAQNISSGKMLLGLPTLERETHTLLSRFESTSEYQFEQQLIEFMTNRKNLIFSNGEKLPDNSVYSQGVQLYQEEIDEKDNQHRVRLSCRELSVTPEKIIVDLVGKGDEMSVVFCSATASSHSVISNFDIQYLSQALGGKVSFMDKADQEMFDTLVACTYPDEHRVEVIPVSENKSDSPRQTLPKKYKDMFSKEAIGQGLPERWFNNTLRTLSEGNGEREFQLNRLFQFIEVYHWFIHNDGTRSMIYFQNRRGDKDKDQVNVLSCLIDGSFVDKSPMEFAIPSDWVNEHIKITKEWEEVESNILTELSSDKDKKIMLVSAYNSFKAGANMQYEIPDGLDYITGDAWTSENERPKKDWDAVFLQSPTAYLMMGDENDELSSERGIYNAMLCLMMLYERGCLSMGEVSYWLNKAMTNAFYFSQKQSTGIMNDKNAWAQTIVEQAVGRLCRTKNKPRTTYILFDEAMKPFFDKRNLDKSLTKEFRALAEYILSHPAPSEVNNDPDAAILVNCANYAQRMIDRMLSLALKYTPHKDGIDEYDDDSEEGSSVPHSVKANQKMNQLFKQTILTKPVINSLDELLEDDRKVTFIDKCYGNWKRNDKNEYYVSYYNKKICEPTSGKLFPHPVSPATVRLDLFMKNPIIRKYFEDKGYATDWKPGELILHPQILLRSYAGEIGEEAFKALLLHYTNCTEDNLLHLEDKLYEYADFVVCNPDGSRKIAFDVKNMRPDSPHEDAPGDMPTKQKRKIRRERLGCEIITVNMVEIPNAGFDDIHEIRGLLDENGAVIPHALDRIIKLVND